MELFGYVGKGKGYDGGERNWGDNPEKIFGYPPFKGTLNIAIRPTLSEEYVLSNCNVITPFKDFVCLEGKINGIKTHMCYSKKRKEHIISTFYVISEIKLRDEFGFKDKDKIKIELKVK